MYKKPPTILGINPGTRYMGIAVFQGNELRDWRIKGTKGKWNKKKLAKTLGIIEEYISHHKPNSVALKKIHSSRTSINLEQLIAGIEKLAEKNEIQVCLYSGKEIKAHFLGGSKGNKRKLSEAITKQHPELFHELIREKSNKNLYYTKLFEAVALGLICHHKLQDKVN